MATGFQRHSRGGRFDEQKRYTGNESLRAREQQIIDALKAQRARAGQYGDEFTRGIESKDRKELENMQLLQNLENNIYEKKRQNIKIRADREVAFIQSQAAELGKEAQFWQTFAPEFFGGVAKIGMAAVQSQQKKQALESFHNLLNSEDYQKFLRGEISSDELTDEHKEDLNILSLTDGKKERLQTLLLEKQREELEKIRNEAFSKGTVEGYEIGNYITSKLNPKNDLVAEFLTSELLQKQNWDSMMQEALAHFSTQIDPTTGQRFNIDDPEIAFKILTTRGKEILDQSGIKNKKLRNKITAKTFSYAAAYRRVETQKQLKFEQHKLASDVLQLALSTKDPQKLKEAIRAKTGTLKPDSRNGLDVYSSADAHLWLFEEMAKSGKYKTKEALYNATYGMPADLDKWGKEPKKGEKPFQTLDKKFPGGFGKLSKLWDDHIKAENSRLNNLRAYEQNVEIEDIDKLLSIESSKGGIDITTPEGREALDLRLRTAKSKGHSKVVSHINGKMYGRDPNADLSIDEHYRFIQEVNNQNWDYVANAYRQMSDKDKKTYSRDYKVLSELNLIGQNTTEVKKIAQGHIAVVIKAASLDSTKHPTAFKAADALEQLFYSKVNSLYGQEEWKGNFAGLAAEAWTLATKDLHANTGLFEYTEAADGPENTVFKHWDTKSKFGDVAPIGWEQVIASVQTGTTAWNSLNLLTTSEIGDVLESAIRGNREIQLPDNVHILHKIGVTKIIDGKPQALSKREIFNELAEVKGFSERLKPGTYDFVARDLESLNIKVSKRLSDNEYKTLMAKVSLAKQFGPEAIIPPWVDKDILNAYEITPDRFIKNYDGSFTVNNQDVKTVLENKHKWGVEVMFTDDGRLRFYSPFGGI